MTTSCENIYKESTQRRTQTLNCAKYIAWVIFTLFRSWNETNRTEKTTGQGIIEAMASGSCG